MGIRLSPIGSQGVKNTAGLRETFGTAKTTSMTDTRRETDNPDLLPSPQLAIEQLHLVFFRQTVRE